MKSENLVNKYATVSTFLISDSLQHVRIRKWNEYWTSERKDKVLNEVRRKGAELKFSDQIIHNFETLLSRDYQVASGSVMGQIRAAFFDDYIIEKNGANRDLIGKCEPRQQTKLIRPIAKFSSACIRPSDAHQSVCRVRQR